MSDNPNPTPSDSFWIGNVGAGAHVAQGKNISWVEGLSGLPLGDTLVRQFAELQEKIDNDPGLDDDARALTKLKATAIAEGLAKAKESPNMLRSALMDAKSWFASTASWVGTSIGEILKSEAAQKTIGTVSEAATKATIDSFLK
jgi:hypothetical protein